MHGLDADIKRLGTVVILMRDIVPDLDVGSCGEASVTWKTGMS